MKRIALNLTIAYIIGIIMGLYKAICIILFLCLFFVGITFFSDFNKIGKNENFWILKYIHKLIHKIKSICIKNKIHILSIIICIVIGYIYINNFSNRWNEISKNTKVNNILAKIVNLEKENTYQATFKIKILSKGKAQNKYMLLKVNTKNRIYKKIKLGSIIKFNGELQDIEIARNFKGFDYQEYLKSKNIYGIIKWKSGEIVYKGDIIPSILTLKNCIIEKAYEKMNNEEANFFLAISIGYKTNLSKDIKDSFNKNNISHMLAISGMHISYILILLKTVLKPFKSKTKSIIIIFFLLFFIQLTGYSISVIKACIIVILNLLAPILYRKSDTITSLSISALLILVENPYFIKNISFIFSYIATLGLIFIYPIIKNKAEIFELKVLSLGLIKTSNAFFNFIISKVTYFIKEIIISSISVNIVLIPIIVYNFNSFSILFILSNLFIMPFFIICVIISFVLIIINFMPINLDIIYKFFSFVLNIVLSISNFLSKFSIFNVLIFTPNICSICIFYVFLVCSLYIKQKKYIWNLLNKKIMFISIIVFISIFLIFFVRKHDLKIFFIDVGQGDCTLIVTPNNKKILIDGGGSENSEFDVGESILKPYLLDRKIMKLDYIIISHFDTDHVRPEFLRL